MALPPAGVPLFLLPVVCKKQISQDTTDAALQVVPCDLQVHEIWPLCDSIGGTTVFTDVDVMIENGTTDIMSAELACVDASAIVGSATTFKVPSTDALSLLSKGDVLHLDINITGGSSPTGEGIGALLVCSRR